MPYSNEHKDRTRARIVDAARKLFNRHGFERVSIARVMSEGGLARMMIDVCLSDEVLDNIDFHCPLYALPGDVVRGPSCRPASAAWSWPAHRRFDPAPLAARRRAPVGPGDARHQLPPVAEASDCVLGK